MKSDIISILSSLPFLISVGLATILGLFVFWLRADSFRFTAFAYKRWWAFGNDHRGEFQRLTNESSDSAVEEGLVQAELTLCQTFKSVISGSSNTEVSENQFNRAKSYLKFTQQTDVRPPSMLARVGLFVLILAESVGTGYVLAPWMSTEITPAQANLAAGILAVAIAIVLAILTHMAGAGVAKFSHYRKHSGSEGGALRIDLGDDQDQDAYYIDANTHAVRQNPQPRRYANRVDDPGSNGPILAVIAGVLVLALMVGIFWIRKEGVEVAAVEQNTTVTQGEQDSRGVSPFGSANTSSLPPSVIQAQQETRQKVNEARGEHVYSQGIAAAFVLALIYFVTQLTAFIVAFKSTFTGQGEEAYNFTRNQPSFETFRAKFLGWKIERAESFLAQLREARKKGNHRIGSAKFKDFINRGEEREAKTRHDLIGNAANDIATGKTDEERGLRWDLALQNYKFSPDEQRKLSERFHESMAHKQGIRQPVPPAYSASAPGEAKPAAPSAAIAVPVDIEQLAKEFMALSDREAKAKFLGAQRKSLSDDAFAGLRNEIERCKRRAQEEEDFGDLLD